MYPIPANATRIRYLESTGTQYVDTGIAFLDDFTWEIKFENSANDSTIFGCGNGSVRTSYIYKRTNSFSGAYAIPVGANNAGATPFTTNLTSGVHTFKFSVANNKGSLWIDGVQTHNQTSFTGEYISGVTAAIFCAHNGTSYNQLAIGKVYFVRLWQGSTLVRDFVPFRIGSVGYLFDRVTGQLFGNAGTGDFVLGPDTFAQGVVPTRMMAMGVRKKLPYDAEVEWISPGQDGVSDNTGNSPYVDTGVDSADDVGFEIDVTRVNDVTWDAVAFGTRLDSSNTRYFVGAVAGGKYYWGWNGRIDSQTIVLNSRHRLGLNFQNSRTATFDDASVSALSGTIGFSKRLYWPVYHTQSNSEPISRSGRWHYHGGKISKGSTVVLDMIPVRIGTTAYWYDRISKTIMKTIGVGSFVYGPDK